MALTLVLMIVLTARGTGALPRRVSGLGHKAVGLAERLQRFRQDIAPAAGHPGVVFQSATVVASYFIALTAVYRSFFGLVTPMHPPFLMLLKIGRAHV